ncbi:MAG TPA: tRNA (adenosine(37)-N6)-threonylcarbamoyltransferase complex transferase subunit TsaD, partial [Armatimonadota bacterium]|nr:tRNA (adenosine(37)-N6)-threonylcarbamoyltransferase complex transferase subunit TsaD [Armatimonadota bacterium]
GGPQLAALADSFSGRLEPLPRAHLPGSRDFSFSGVKTALARAVRAAPLDDDRRAALAAAYQESIARSLTDRTLQVAEEIGNCTVLVVGGVARNARLRALLTQRAQTTGIPVHFPDPAFCTDNAAMVAAAGLYKLARVGADPPDLDCSPNPPLRSWREESQS